VPATRSHPSGITPRSSPRNVNKDVGEIFKIGKQCLGWEDVPVLALEAVRTLVALCWVAAGILYELGVTLGWPEARLLTRLGGGECAPTARPVSSC